MTKDIVNKIKSLYQKSKLLKLENNELKKQLNYSITSSSIPQAPSLASATGDDDGMDIVNLSVSSTSNSSIPTLHNSKSVSSSIKTKNSINNRTSKIPSPSPSSSIRKKNISLTKNKNVEKDEVIGDINDEEIERCAHQ